MAYAYADLTQIKEAGWLNITSASFDVDLLRILEQSSVYMDRYCRRQFQATEGTKYLDGADGNLDFGILDVLSLSAFALDQDGSQGYATSLATTDYVLYPLNQFPATHAKMSMKSSQGAFASGIRQGVKLTGVFGFGDGESATPYSASGATVAAAGWTAAATSVSVTAGGGALLAVGQTVRVDTEQVYITAISTDTLTVVRGRNGTTAAAHSSAAALQTYRYPGPVAYCTLLQASRAWKRRESPAGAVLGAQNLMGTIAVAKGLDPDIEEQLQTYIKRVFA